MTTLPPLSIEGLEIRSVDDGKVLRLAWIGEASMRDPTAAISPYLSRAVEAAQGQRDLVLDFSQLAFMNSSTLLPIVEAVRRMQESHVTGRLLYRKDVSWQRVGHACMKNLLISMNGITVDYV